MFEMLLRFFDFQLNPMVRLNWSFSVFITIFVSSLSGCAFFAPLPASVEQQVNESIRYDLDGTIVYVDVGGAQKSVYSAGWQDRDNQIPMQPNTLFKIASISKLYVAAAAAILISEGKLELDASLATYLPQLSEPI